MSIQFLDGNITIDDIVNNISSNELQLLLDKVNKRKAREDKKRTEDLKEFFEKQGITTAHFFLKAYDSEGCYVDTFAENYDIANNFHIADGRLIFTEQIDVSEWL